MVKAGPCKWTVEVKPFQIIARTAEFLTGILRCGHFRTSVRQSADKDVPVKSGCAGHSVLPPDDAIHGHFIDTFVARLRQPETE